MEGMIMFIAFIMSCLLVFVLSDIFYCKLLMKKIEKGTKWGIVTTYSIKTFAPSVTGIYIWLIWYSGIWAYIMRPLGSF